MSWTWFNLIRVIKKTTTSYNGYIYSKDLYYLILEGESGPHIYSDDLLSTPLSIRDVALESMQSDTGHWQEKYISAAKTPQQVFILLPPGLVLSFYWGSVNEISMWLNNTGIVHSWFIGFKCLNNRCFILFFK